MKELQQQVEQIADIINNGYKVEADELAQYDAEYQEGDTLSGFDYIADACDIRYLTQSNGELLQGQVCVAYGGPNIWVNIWSDGSGTVEGYWWADRATATIQTDAMGVFDALAELKDC